jgi:hypothetical protein
LPRELVAGIVAGVAAVGVVKDIAGVGFMEAFRPKFTDENLNSQI